jgi:glucarate dehydratase
MKIVKVQATPVRLKTKRSNATARGRGRFFSRTIVQLETDTGLTGLGECPRSVAAETITRRFGPRVLGLHPADWRVARSRCLPPYREWGLIDESLDYFAFSGIEMAMWDLFAKSCGLPLYKVLGGAAQKKVPFVAYAYAVDKTEGHSEKDIPEIMANVARTMVDQTGCKIFEFKVGHNTVDCEIETIRAVRKALPSEIGIALDANMGYSLSDARRLLAGIAGIAIENFEEPVARLKEMEALNREFNVPLSTHCTNPEILAYYPRISGVVGDFALEGGLGELFSVARQVRGVGKQFWLHTYQEAGISWAARCHFSAACTDIGRPGQALTYWAEDDLVEGEPWLINDGGVGLPEKPGLGVELDHAAVALAHESYLKEGEENYLVPR